MLFCVYSQQEIASYVNFEIHQIHCKRNIVLCPECKEPVRKAELDEHMEEEHAPKPCELCGKMFPPDQLENHKVASHLALH